MASRRVLDWIERLVWLLIYVGLFCVVLGVATGGAHLVAGWSLGVVGGVLAAAGVVLIWVRSRLRETPSGGAQSDDNPTRGSR